MSAIQKKIPSFNIYKNVFWLDFFGGGWVGEILFLVHDLELVATGPHSYL